MTDRPRRRTVLRKKARRRGTSGSPPESGFVPAILYVAVPLAVLAFVAKGHWTELFRRIRGRDWLLMLIPWQRAVDE